MTTAYGHTLGLSRAGSVPAEERDLHLYHDLAPVNSLVVSTQGPQRYYSGITSQPAKFTRFPGLCFVELALGALATNPLNGPVGDLPYPYIHHLREALLQRCRRTRRCAATRARGGAQPTCRSKPVPAPQPICA